MLLDFGFGDFRKPQGSLHKATTSTLKKFCNKFYFCLDKDILFLDQQILWVCYQQNFDEITTLTSLWFKLLFTNRSIYIWPYLQMEVDTMYIDGIVAIFQNSVKEKVVNSFDLR